jgi:hypothetical protein
MKKIFFAIFFLSSLFLKPSRAAALEPLSLIINEIAWMGTESSYNDEWLELYNNSSVEIDLAGWKIKSINGKLNIELSGKITPREFFILERTDDQSLPNIPADLIYKGALNNSGEYVELISNENQIIDEINCENGWFAGNNETKQTMERKNYLNSGNDKNNWQTSINSGGTPKIDNFTGTNEADNKNEKSDNKNQILLPTTSTNHSFQVCINELLPSPKGADRENEWIELLNEGEDLNISGWQIRDSLGKTQSYSFPENTTIKNNNFLVLPGSLTKIILNNDGDSILLINPGGEIISSVSFEKAPQDKSYSRINNQWIWTSLPTPGNKNILLESKKNDYNTSSSIDSLELKKSENTVKTKGLASVYESIPKFNFSFILLSALSLSFFSGIIFILIKKRLLI